MIDKQSLWQGWRGCPSSLVIILAVLVAMTISTAYQYPASIRPVMACWEVDFHSYLFAMPGVVVHRLVAGEKLRRSISLTGVFVPKAFSLTFYFI